MKESIHAMYDNLFLFAVVLQRRIGTLNNLSATVGFV
jgi:hypothetical protein